jgi:hypothetical protein
MVKQHQEANMQIKLNSLPFNLPEKPFTKAAETFLNLETELKKLVKRAGTDNDKFKIAWRKLYNTVQAKQSIEQALTTKIDIRALGIALTSDFKEKIIITNDVLNKIDKIADKPSTLFIENFFQYYLNDFTKINNIEYASHWLIQARKMRKLTQWYDEKLISSDGAKWVAEQAITKNKDFDQVIHELELDQYQSGDFMESAQRIYYVEQLKSIPANQPNDLLVEVQKKDVYQSRFDQSELLGHKILKILIERAPSENIHESWLNAIMAIAGDPRIPKSHQRYIIWWSHIPAHFIAKVRGWLSRLDLKLFLEALEDFSNSSYDPEMRRMYPSRKRFLEGLYDKKLIQNTRLYMSRKMAHFLKNNYKSEHLPDFSIVADGDKSIIYVDLGDAHILEGSHSCYLWIYKALDPSATVFDYGKTQETYNGLTAGLDRKMWDKGVGALANITHNPANFSWQRKAIETLADLRVPVTIKDVLTPEDYRTYVRRFGAS